MTRALAILLALRVAAQIWAVDFEREILPILKESCLACHNQTKAKADLVLETPLTILKGGESGPAVVPGKPAESLLLKLAERREKPVMPPKDNKVNAPDLSDAQLGLLRQWIVEGATGEVRGADTVAWQTLGEAVHPILALAATEEGHLAFCGRGNQLMVFDLVTRHALGVLADPALPRDGTAHLDLVRSVDCTWDGEWIASGGFREVKLWRREPLRSRALTNSATATNSLESVSSAGDIKATVTNGCVQILGAEDSKLLRELRGDFDSVSQIRHWGRAFERATNFIAYRRSLLEKAEKERQAQVERVRKASDAAGTALKALTEQTNKLSAVKAEEANARQELAGFAQRLKQSDEEIKKLASELEQARTNITGNDSVRIDLLIAIASKFAIATNTGVAAKAELEKSEKTGNEKLKAVQGKLAEAEALLKRGQLTNSAAENELAFAIAAAQSAADLVVLSQTRLQTGESDARQIELQLGLVSRKDSKTNTVAIALSPDAALLAALDASGAVTVWHVDSGAPLATLACAANQVWFDGPALVTAGHERTEAWDLYATWKLQRTIGVIDGKNVLSDRVNAVRFSPDGQYLATGSGEPSRSGEVKIWRVRDGGLAQDLSGLHSDAVFTLGYSPDGRYLASGSADRFARLTDLATGRVARVLEGHTDHVLALDWKDDGHTIVTGGADNLIKLWDAFSGEKKKGPEPFAREVNSVLHVSGQDQIIAAVSDGSLRLLKEQGEKIRSFEGATAYLHTATIGKDAKSLVAGGQDGVLRMWDLETGQLLQEFKAMTPRAQAALQH